MSSKRILILTPTTIERGAFDKLSVDGADIRIAVSGVGMAETAGNTARALAGGVGGWQPAVAILAGIAGAYPGMGFSAGDCIAVTAEKVADLGAVRSGTFAPLYEKEYGCPLAGKIKSIPTGRSLTVSCIGGAYGEEPHTEGYHIENMEGAAFFAVCLALDVPFLELRSVSNLTCDPREGWRISDALTGLRVGTQKIVAELLTSGEI